MGNSVDYNPGVARRLASRGARRMTDGEPPLGGEATFEYTYRPSLLGAPWVFALKGDTLEWRAGRKSGSAALRAIRRMRLSFRPVTMQSRRFLTEIWAEGAPKLEICSSSWKSMVEQERLDRGYVTFVTELHRSLAQAGTHVRYEQGSDPFLYWPGLAVFAAVALALAFLCVRGLQAQAWGGTAFVVAFLLVFLWQAGNYFRRNRPGHYRPEHLPAELMPAP
jgi:hypothetical protein